MTSGDQTFVLCLQKPAEVPPRTQSDNVALDMIAVPSTESALNTPPATVEGISSCPELCDKVGHGFKVSIAEYNSGIFC